MHKWLSRLFIFYLGFTLYIYIYISLHLDDFIDTYAIYVHAVNNLPMCKLTILKYKFCWMEESASNKVAADNKKWSIRYIWDATPNATSHSFCFCIHNFEIHFPMCLWFLVKIKLLTWLIRHLTESSYPSYEIHGVSSQAEKITQFHR